jgi:hypothetical protein
MNNKGSVPEPILKIFPNLTYDKYQQKKSDPLFLYDSMRLCEVCYVYIKNLIEHLNTETIDKDEKVDKLKKIAALVYKP